jgi:hypothetical protein
MLKKIKVKSGFLPKKYFTIPVESNREKLNKNVLLKAGEQ